MDVVVCGLLLGQKNVTSAPSPTSNTSGILSFWVFTEDVNVLTIRLLFALVSVASAISSVHLYFFLRRRLNEYSRTVALVGNCAALTGSSFICMLALMLMYGYETLVIGCVPLLQLVFALMHIKNMTRIHLQNFRPIDWFFTFSCSISSLNFLQMAFPQKLFAECTGSSLFAMSVIYTIFSVYSSEFCNSLISIVKILSSDKLHFYEGSRTAGFLAKQEDIWVTFVFSNKPTEEETLLPA